MKMVYVIYNIGVDEEVMETLRQAGVEKFTKWPRVLGIGQKGGARLDNHTWPGVNAAVMAVVEDERAPKVMAVLSALRERIGAMEGLQAFVVPVDSQLT